MIYILFAWIRAEEINRKALKLRKATNDLLVQKRSYMRIATPAIKNEINFDHLPVIYAVDGEAQEIKKSNFKDYGVAKSFLCSKKIAYLIKYL